MGFPDNVLAKGERVERSLHPHWLTVVIPTLFGLVLAALCFVIVRVTPDDTTGNRIQLIAIIVLVLIAMPLVFVPYLRWRTTHYVITTHRVMVRRGILTKTGKDITLSKITDVSFEQSLLDRIIGAGSLHIESAGDSPDENLTYIPRSNDVQQLINRLIDEDDLRRRARGRAFERDLDDEYAAGGPDDTRSMPQGGSSGNGGRDRPQLAEERPRPPHELPGD